MGLKAERVLILGGSGLLGSAAIELLLAKGFEVVNVDLRENPKLVSRNLQQVIWSGASDAEAKSVVGRLWGQGPFTAFVGMAAENPKVEGGGAALLDIDRLNSDSLLKSFSAGVVSNFLFAKELALKAKSVGSALSLVFVGSDYAHLAPDQRLYPKGHKPISYSITKNAVVGMSNYFSTWSPGSGIRSNVLSPGGVQNAQDEEFVSRLENRIPLGRMATKVEVASAVCFLCGDESSYFNGHHMIMDGGRSVW